MLGEYYNELLRLLLLVPQPDFYLKNQDHLIKALSGTATVLPMLCEMGFVHAELHRTFPYVHI